MAFIKKIFEDGNQFTADDANNIQLQYDGAIETIDNRQEDFALSLYNETFEGNGSTQFYELENDLIAQPIIIVKRLTDSFYRAETVASLASGLPAQWHYGANVVTHDPGEPLLVAGEFLKVGYVLRMVPHADTHKTGGSDAIDIHDIGGLTAAEINEIAQDCVGIDEATAEQIAADIKASDQHAAVCRTVLNEMDLETNEIAILL